MSRPSRIRTKRETSITLDSPGYVTLSELEQFIVEARDLKITDVAELAVSIDRGHAGPQGDPRDPTCTITATAPPSQDRPSRSY
jgi:hypothetical protein